jgi:dTDP-4-amino-4,6-dideoxygalactose transaminase
MVPYALPPAETRLSLRALARGIFPGKHDFTGKLTRFLNAESCVLANSARSLLYLVFRELKKNADPGQNQILIPGYTCYSVPAAVVKAGLKVSLFDLNPNTFQPDLDDLRQKVSERTLAVVGQHLLSVPADIKELAGISDDHGICCIEDAAQMLQEAGEKYTRTDGADYTVYSFGRGKPLPLGQGGALISRKRADLDSMASQMETPPVQNGKSLMPAAVRILSWPGLYWFLEKLPLGLGRTIYDPGFQVAGMSLAYQCLGDSALDDLGRLNRHRSLIAKIYNKAFEADADAQGIMVPPVRYPLLVDQQEKVDKLAGYGVRRLYPKALCDLEELKPELTDPDVQTPGAREISRRLITLPTHLGVSEHLARKISNLVKKLFTQISFIRG